MKDKDQLIKHGSIMLAATYLSGIFNGGYHLVMVRMLGPVEYGTLFSLIGLFMMISLPANTLQTVISKYISIFKARKEFGKMSYLLVHSFEKLVKILGGLLLLYLLFSKKISINQQLQSVMPVIIMGPIFCFGILLPIYYGALQGLERFTELGLLSIAGAFARILFGVLLVYTGFGVNGAIFGSLVSCFVILGASFWFLRDILNVKSYDKNVGKGDIYKYFIPVSIAYTCYGIATYIDVVIVKHYFSPLDAGHYSIVSMIGKNFLFPAMAFAGAMFPKVSNQFAQGKETRHLLQKTLIYSGLISLAGIIVCVFFPNGIMYIFMSKKDITEEAAAVMVPLLRIIGFTVTPYGLACIVINYYLAKHWTKFLPFLVITMVLQIALLIMFHNTLIQVLTILFVAGIFILLCPALLTRNWIRICLNKIAQLRK